MAEQDEGRPFKVQPKPSLPVSPKTGAYYRGLPDAVEPSRATGEKGEVTTIYVST